jgi:hypothetical protein
MKCDCCESYACAEHYDDWNKWWGEEHTTLLMCSQHKPKRDSNFIYIIEEYQEIQIKTIYEVFANVMTKYKVFDKLFLQHLVLLQVKFLHFNPAVLKRVINQIKVKERQKARKAAQKAAQKKTLFKKQN